MVAMRPIEVGGSSPASGNVVLRLFLVVGTHVAARQPASAEFDWPVDHGVAGVELLALPRPGCFEPAGLLVVAEVVEHRDLERALAPLDVVVARCGLGHLRWLPLRAKRRPRHGRSRRQANCMCA